MNCEAGRRQGLPCGKSVVTGAVLTLPPPGALPHGHMVCPHRGAISTGDAIAGKAGTHPAGLLLHLQLHNNLKRERDGKYNLLYFNGT